jgi:PAS domain S-box-containing protein/putative nucleotidyltransferase with HDIG domain
LGTEGPDRKTRPVFSAVEETFQWLFSRGPVPMWIVDPESLVVMDASPAALEQTGVEIERVLGKSFLDFLPMPETRRSFLQFLERNGSAESAWQGPLRGQTGSWQEVQLRPDRVEWNGRSALLIAAQPVQNELSQWADAFEYSAQGISMSDPHTNQVRVCNPAFARLVGRTVDEVKGMPISELYEPAERERVMRMVEQGDRDGYVQYESAYLRPDGTVIPVQVDVVSVRDSQSRLLYRVATAQDIRRHVQAESGLREVKERLEEAEARASLGSWEFEISTGQGWWSKQMFEMTGFDPQEGVPSWERYLEFIHPEDRDYMRQVEEMMHRGIEPPSQEFRSNPQRGPLRIFLPTVHATRNRHGKLIKFGGTIMDVSEQKRVEEEVRRRNEELSTLYELSTALRKTRTSRELIEVVLEHTLEILQAQSGYMALLDEEQKQFTITFAAGRWKEAQGSQYSIHEGLSGITVRSSQPVVTENYSTEPKALPLEWPPASGPAVFVPLRSEVELLGVMALARDQGAPAFVKDNVRLLSSIGDLTGNALRRQNLFEMDRKRLNQIQALHRIDLAITGLDSLEDTLSVLLEEVCSQQKVDAAAILIYEEDSGELVCRQSRGFHNPENAEIRLKAGDGLAWLALGERRVVRAAEMPHSFAACPRLRSAQEEGFLEYFTAPLVTRGKAQGVLEVFNRSPLQISEDWTSFLRALAEQAAIAIADAALVSGLQAANQALIEAYDATIIGWSNALDMRDKETEEHTLRVTELTLRLARSMGVGEEDLKHIRRGALLHDIGKMGVPDSILNKPVQLNEEEEEIMRRHPQLAYDLLKPIEYLRQALEIPYYHHEHWNGQGYPNGLKGEDIPLSARIFAVVDVWDALRSERPYAPAWPEDQVLGYIRDLSGVQFDPQVAEAFLRLMEQEAEDGQVE